MTCKSPFGIAFKTFAGKKALNEYVKIQKEFIEPKKVSLGFDPMTQKQNTIQSVPILSTLKAIFSHEEVLTYVLEQNVSNNFNFKTFKDGTAYRTNPFMNANLNILEICIYHDDFGIVNPLGNKTHKHKISAFNFVLENLPFKYRSRFNDINLIVLCPASYVDKYGHTFPINKRFENSRNIWNYSKL